MNTTRFIQILIFFTSMNSVAFGQSFNFGGGGLSPDTSLGEGLPPTNIDLGNQWGDLNTPRFKDWIDEKEPHPDDVGPMDPPKNLPTPLDLFSDGRPNPITNPTQNSQPNFHGLDAIYPPGPNGGLSDPPNHPPRPFDLLVGLSEDDIFYLRDNLLNVDWENEDIDLLNDCQSLAARNYSTFEFVAPFLDGIPSRAITEKIHTVWAKQRACSMGAPIDTFHSDLVFLNEEDPLCFYYTSKEHLSDIDNAHSDSEVKFLNSLNHFLISCAS